jgi:hypothetical protein
METKESKNTVKKVEEISKIKPESEREIKIFKKFVILR